MKNTCLALSMLMVLFLVSAVPALADGNVPRAPHASHAAPDGTPDQLSLTVPDFAPLFEGYAQPRAQPITIKNNSDVPATKINVHLEADNNKFVLTGAGDTVQPNGEINTWFVRPSASLEPGLHEATVTVEYTRGYSRRAGNRKTTAAVVTFIVIRPIPPRPDPEMGAPKPDAKTTMIVLGKDGSLKGSLGIGGLNGITLPVVVEIRDREGEAILLTARVEAQLNGNGKLVFELWAQGAGARAAEKPEDLEPGEYTVYVSSPGNGMNYGFAATPVGGFSIEAPAEWFVPETLAAADKVAYNLVTYSDAGEKPALTATVSNPAALSVDKATFELVAALQSNPADNVATVTFADQKGNRKVCKVTVIPNRFYRGSALRIGGIQGVFSSTNHLYYNGSNLQVNTFLLNKRKSKVLYKAGLLTLVLYKGDTPIYTERLDTWRMDAPLKYNAAAVYQIALTPERLKGTGLRIPYDLTTGEYQAVLTRSSNVIPVRREGTGVIVQKGVTIPEMIIKSTPQSGKKDRIVP